MRQLLVSLLILWLAARATAPRPRPAALRRVGGGDGGRFLVARPQAVRRAAVTADERDAEIRERYARAIAVWDVREGRDRLGFLPYERTRFNAFVKGGCTIEGAVAVMLEDQRG